MYSQRVFSCVRSVAAQSTPFKLRNLLFALVLYKVFRLTLSVCTDYAQGVCVCSHMSVVHIHARTTNSLRASDDLTNTVLGTNTQNIRVDLKQIRECGVVLLSDV